MRDRFSPSTLMGPNSDPRAGETTASPAHLKRLIPATLNRLGGLVPNLTVEPHPDGRVSITLPLQWASLLLANLQAQAHDFKEKLQRATWQEQKKQADLRASLAESQRQWEMQQVAVHALYKQLLKNGLTHREALYQLKSDAWTITMLQTAIEKGGARERRQQRSKRDKRIFDMVNQGIGRREVSERLGLTVVQVKEALRRGRMEKGGGEA
ncbi:MAG: hypothetical protein O6929_04025 [candidate division NC10 bacterium]|nr:hypothetical protein [candidate division NC10 bacterium]